MKNLTKIHEINPDQKENNNRVPTRLNCSQSEDDQGQSRLHSVESTPTKKNQIKFIYNILYI